MQFRLRTCDNNQLVVFSDGFRNMRRGRVSSFATIAMTPLAFEPTDTALQWLLTALSADLVPLSIWVFTATGVARLQNSGKPQHFRPDVLSGLS